MITKPVAKAGIVAQQDTATFGLFHQWGSDYDEYQDGPGNFTVAIVEMPDGTVKSVNPSEIKFIEE